MQFNSEKEVVDAYMEILLSDLSEDETLEKLEEFENNLPPQFAHMKAVLGPGLFTTQSKPPQE